MTSNFSLGFCLILSALGLGLFSYCTILGLGEFWYFDLDCMHEIDICYAWLHVINILIFSFMSFNFGFW